MNCKLLKFCWIPVLLFFFNSWSFAQINNEATKDSATSAVEEDSVNNDYESVADTLIIKTVFAGSNDSILKWKRGREFGYMAYLDSLLRKKTDLQIETVSIDNGTVHRSRTTDAA